MVQQVHHNEKLFSFRHKQNILLIYAPKRKNLKLFFLVDLMCGFQNWCHREII